MLSRCVWMRWRNSTPCVYTLRRGSEEEEKEEEEKAEVDQEEEQEEKQEGERTPALPPLTD